MRKKERKRERKKEKEEEKRKGKERKGKERKGKERKGKERASHCSNLQLELRGRVSRSPSVLTIEHSGQRPRLDHRLTPV